MADLSITASAVGLVRAEENGLITKPAGAALTAGMVVRENTSGQLVGADASAAGTADIKGIALASVASGQAVTALRDGLVDIGNALSSIAIGASIYLSDTGTNTGVMADAAGTSSAVVGVVTSGWGYTTADKLLRVKL